MAAAALDDLPGFRRRFVVTPHEGRVTAAVEDDYHCMAVTLHHDGTTVTAVAPMMERAPWTTCPGAGAVLAETFVGVALADVVMRGEKRANCTHLYDLAMLAAAHAADPAPIVIDILVCDAIDGMVTAEIRRDGTAIHRIVHRDDVVVAPATIAGVSLFKLRGWIEGLDASEREAAKMLQWGTIMGHGRSTPMERQSDATRMPPNCYTFQPGNKEVAHRIGRIIDFSNARADPLEHLDGGDFRSRDAEPAVPPSTGTAGGSLRQA